MEKQNWNFYWKWSVFVLMTMLCLVSFYKSYQNVKSELLEESQTLFQQAVQYDTNRRIKDLGDAFCFSYSGANRLERDSITITTADTIIHIKNNKEVARRMSSQEKSDFCLQYGLSMENPIQVALLDSAFCASLYEHAIPAQTVTCYTFIDKTERSIQDTSFYRSFMPLKEIVFGANRTIVLQAFIHIPFLYIVGEVLSQNIFWIIVIVILWVIAIVLTWKGPRINILPLQEAPKEMIQIAEDILFDETHGVLYCNERRIELANQRLKLFCILLEHKGYFVESNQLKEEIWPDGSVSKDALIATAKRLKEDLSPIPGLVIESARGRGYMLK
ncbi:MAG: helix-turn-helix domain-containing protein [Parabacteroides sp.]|nr:helix-turn-helix domain-containing protein [Parabacteroides sp.]